MTPMPDPGAGQPSRLAALTSPKSLITFLITVILVVGEARYGALGGFEKLALTLGTCVLVEAGLGYFLLGRVPPLQSAYISGVSLSLLLRPTGGLAWPFVVGAALAIGSKYVLRYRGRHLWNPSNLGIALLLLLAPNRVAILSHELGNDLVVNAVIWGLGLLIAARARVLHVSATYALAFVTLAAGRAWLLGAPLLAELAPITGPMYQLLVFFMLTDPRTTVRSRRGRILTVLVVALVEAGIRLGNDLEVAALAPLAPAPPILALFVVGPIALYVDLLLAARASAAAPSREVAPAPRAEPAADAPAASRGGAS